MSRRKKRSTCKKCKARRKNRLFGVFFRANSLLVRFVAVFFSYAFNAVAAGALVGVNVGKAILMAGIMGLATTFTYMARAYIDDGKMTSEELNTAFQRTSEKLDE